MGPVRVDAQRLGSSDRCRYATSAFPVYAEPVPKVGDTEVSAIDSPSSAMMIRIAKKHGVYLIGGSVPEREVGLDGKEKIYNTCSKRSLACVPMAATWGMLLSLPSHSNCGSVS